MKKNLYIANLLVAGLMTFTGCTDGFESDNANKAGYTPELQEYDLQKYVLKFLQVMSVGFRLSLLISFHMVIYFSE